MGDSGDAPRLPLLCIFMPLSEYSIYDFILTKYKIYLQSNLFFITTKEISTHFGVSRQFVHKMIIYWVRKGYLVKHGGTKNASYTISPTYIHDIISRKGRSKLS